jgi:hypothetical protein
MAMVSPEVWHEEGDREEGGQHEVDGRFAQAVDRVVLVS